MTPTLKLTDLIREYIPESEIEKNGDQIIINADFPVMGYWDEGVEE